MVGNDVIDLGDAEARDGPSHPRFDARVFAPSELAALARSSDRNRLRWTLWAAKEASYKLAVKRAPGSVFSPCRYVVELRDVRRARVRYPGGVAAVELKRRGDALHAVASDGSSRRLVAAVRAGGVAAEPAATSRAVRRLAREKLAAALGVAPDRLRFGRRGRVPTLRLAGDSRRFDLSLSHHGRYLAFACALAEGER